MIDIKMRELLNSTDALQALSKKEMKARLALTVGKLLKLAESELDEFNKVRMDLIKKYGEKDEQGELITNESGNCKIRTECASDFNSELEDLFNAQVSLNANKIRLQDLESLEFTPSEMVVLESFIEMDEE